MNPGSGLSFVAGGFPLTACGNDKGGGFVGHGSGEAAPAHTLGRTNM